MKDTEQIWVGPHPAGWTWEELRAHCLMRFVRRSGPGGQNRNKVETGVVLEFVPANPKILAEASERRSQAENLEVAAFRLRLLLALRYRCEVTDRDPSRLWCSRCHNGQIAVNPQHGDFPTLLAEALDFVWAHGQEMKPSALALGGTISQLQKFLKIEPRAWQLVNRIRRESGRRTLC